MKVLIQLLKWGFFPSLNEDGDLVFFKAGEYPEDLHVLLVAYADQISEEMKKPRPLSRERFDAFTEQLLNQLIVESEAGNKAAEAQLEAIGRASVARELDDFEAPTVHSGPLH